MNTKDDMEKEREEGWKLGLILEFPIIQMFDQIQALPPMIVFDYF